MDQQNILTKRNKPTFEHDGFLFLFEKMSKNGDIKFWRCQHFSSKSFKCHGRLHTRMDGTVLCHFGTHSCPAMSVENNITAQRVIKTETKRRKKDKISRIHSRKNTEENEQDLLAITVNQMVDKLKGHGMALCKFRRQITEICLDFDEWLAGFPEANQQQIVNVEDENMTME